MFKPCAKWVSDIKFNPQNNIVVIGSHDTYIYIFTPNLEEYSLAKKAGVKKHSSYITHIDFSKDG